jgi:hypothetical protein
MALTIAGGALVSAAGAYLWRTGAVPNGVFVLPEAAFLAGTGVGVAIVVVGMMMGAFPRLLRPLGGVALAGAAASLPLAFGGFVVGFVLVAIGGGIAASPRPPVAIVTPAAPVPGRAPPWT